MHVITHLSLFTGIGGIDLAAELAGIKTVGQCEFADYPTRVLEKHWPDVPRWRDIRTLTGVDFYEKSGLRTVDVISGGFPCQPFSVAGKQKGKEDGRYLWPEMLRVIQELNPSWVVGENVPGILRIAGDTVCQDLEREGYSVRILNYEAAAVGAPHRRERMFFVANRDGNCGDAQRTDGVEYVANKSRYDVSDTNNGCGVVRWYREFQTTTETSGGREDHGRRASEHVTRQWWKVESDVGRVVNGIPNRVDRLRCLGNAVVPQQAYPIFKAIFEIEEGSVR